MRVKPEDDIYLQKLGINKESTVNISNRPMSISIAIYIFAKSVRWAKLPAGPFEPKPGPTLLIAVIEAPIASSKVIPVRLRTRKLKKISNIY